MIYLTFNDLPSGIYKSQVIDVCTYLNTLSVNKTRLVSFISIRGFFKNRKKIKQSYPHSIILPMFPKLKNWRINIFLLGLVIALTGEEKVMARGPFACALANKLKQEGKLKKVIFDARGAYYAEFSEYLFPNDFDFIAEVESIERDCVIESDYRLAVSRKLVEYWQDQFNYHGHDFTIIPCTISDDFETILITPEKIQQARINLGFSETDVVLVYSGSSAGWQSFDLVDSWLHKLMGQQPNVKLLLLARDFPSDSEVIQVFPDRVIKKWVAAAEVPAFLMACDYGLLIRESSGTNKVASPVKLAEYLSCGLKVIVSEEIGDYSQLIIENDFGFHYKNWQNEILLRPELNTRMSISRFAIDNLSKSKFNSQYESIFTV